MAEVNMPRLSDTMQEGTITRWLKKPGDEIKKGEVVAEVETDKANMEIESYSAGILERILIQEGETAPIGQPIAVVGSGTNVQKAGQATASNVETPAKTQPKVEVPAARVVVEQVSPQASRNGGMLKVSPLARRMAEEHGVDLKQLTGTGPGGRIVRDDIEDAIGLRTGSQQAVAQATPVNAPAASQADVEVVNLSSMQKTIARRLTESKQTVPHFYISSVIDLTEALEVRQKLNANLDKDGVKVSVNDLVIKACAQALQKFPEVNSSYKDGQFLLHKHINIGIAIDIPAGLVVPVIRDANLKGLRTIASEAKALVAKAQAGKLTAAELDGGTFSISNLGMMDVSEFVAVINPPQSAILAVAASRKTFVPVNDQPVVRDLMNVTLSADHRILYGATVARFLQEVKRQLQNIYLLLG